MKKILLASLVLNIIFLVIIFWPKPKDEKEVIDKMHDLKKMLASQTTKKTFAKNSDQIFDISYQILRKISAKWDVETFKSLFSKNLSEKVTDNQILKLLNMFKKLGKFEKGLLPRTLSHDFSSTNCKKLVMRCKFEHGEAYVTMIIVKENEKWLLKGFRLNSELFLQNI